MTESEARVTSEALPLETVNAMASAWWESHGAEPLWDELDELDRDVCRADMRAALSAGLTQGGIVLREQLNKTRALLDACEREVRELSGDESDA